MHVLPTLLFLAVLPQTAQARSVTDSAGRTVEVPDRIERLYASGPPASVLVYALAAETRRFYELFYHVTLSDAELGRLLQWTKGSPQ